MEAEQPLRIFIWNINSLVPRAAVPTICLCHFKGVIACQVGPGVQVPTVRNFVLKHGSLRGFFEHHQADIVCFQVRMQLKAPVSCAGGCATYHPAAGTATELSMLKIMFVNLLACIRQWYLTATLPSIVSPTMFTSTFRALQETKVLAEKLTRELACVDGFESFWAVSREKKGYSGAPSVLTGNCGRGHSHQGCFGDVACLQL